MLFLVPAVPEALLIARDGRILTSTRKGRTGKFEIPGGAQAPDAPPIRAELADPDEFPVGATVTLAGVTGYAVAWNTGFGGVPPADVIVE